MTTKITNEIISPLCRVFVKNETLIRQSYALSSSLPIYLVIKEDRFANVTCSAYQLLKEKWLLEATIKKRIFKDYIPGDREEEILLEIEKYRWIANRAIALLHDLGQMDEAEKSSLNEKIDTLYKTVRQAAGSRIEANFEFYKVKAVNPEIDQIERGKSLIENAIKSNDQRALLELKLKYGAVLSKEHLYSRRSESFVNRVYETEEKLYESFWELETLLRGLFDRYSQYLFTTLQTLLSHIESPEHQSSLMNLVTENEEIQRQACILYDRAKKRTGDLKSRAQNLQEISSNMNMILTQLNSMNDYMQNAILDICKSWKPS